MRRALLDKFGRVSSSIKPAILRALYRELTHDASAPSNMDEAEIDERVKLVLEMEDPDIVIDLRHLNSRRKGQYDTFWRVTRKRGSRISGSRNTDHDFDTESHAIIIILW